MLRIFLSDPDGFVSEEPRLDPFRSTFRRAAMSAGHTIQNTFEPTPDICLLRNFRINTYRTARRYGLTNHQIVLFLTEPPSVHPRQYRTGVISRFPTVYSRSVSRVLPENVTQANYFDFVATEDWLPDPKAPRERCFALIQANKVSSHTDERYTFRRRLIDVLQENQIPISVAGIGWNDSRATQLRKFAKSLCLSVSSRSKLSFDQKPLRPTVWDLHGQVASKRDFLSKYEFNVVIENQRDYVSEKLFDSLSAGCITLYDGPDLAMAGLNPKIALPLATNENARLAQFRRLLTLNPDEISLIRREQQDAFESDAVTFQDVKIARQILNSMTSEAL